MMNRIAEADGMRRGGAERRDVLTDFVRKIHVNRSVGQMAALLVAAFAVFTILRPAVFLGSYNLQVIALAAPEIGILAIAMMVTMLSGGIDLSVVSIANASAITISMTYTAVSSRAGVELANSLALPLVLLGLVVGVAAGAINGLLIAKVGITPILATLGTMQLFNGLELVVTGGRTLYGAPAGLSTLGTTTFLGVPAIFLILVVVAVAIGVLLDRISLGFRIRYQGANAEASRFSGISSTRTLLATYTIVGLLGGIAGVVFLSRNPSASADYGASYTLLVIVIAVLGGTNPYGGRATVLGVVLATLCLQVVASGFTAMRLSSQQYAMAQGVILIGAMVLDYLRGRGSSR
jgi:simple sugar transport system permease protein